LCSRLDHYIPPQEPSRSRPGPKPPAATMTPTHPYRRKVLLFSLLSATDLALTTYLVWGTEGRGSESNPVAGWWLAEFGWIGLALYKAAAVLLAGMILLVLCRLSPRTGGRVLGFSCVILTGVVCYSALLAGLAHADASRENAETASLAAVNDELDASAQLGVAYRVVLLKASQDLHAGRISLAEAVHRLLQTARGQDPAWIEQLRIASGGETPEECLARTLLRHVAGLCEDNPERCQEVRARLTAEFQACFATPLPRRELVYWAAAGAAIWEDDAAYEDWTGEDERQAAE
jgi:hypothetical protein